MEINFIYAFVVFTVLVIIAALIFILRIKMGIQKNSQNECEAQSFENLPIIVESTAKITIGVDSNSPIVTIEPLQSLIEFENAKPLDECQAISIKRMAAIFQAAPSLFVAGEASGKHLMEVVINGDLVRSADGSGLRAFSMNANGIRENARLFEVSNLQNMINAAAIWQIASVVVAQKHLADISKKLDEIKVGIEGISRFLDGQRKSRIEATFMYLEQINNAIKDGELSTSVRNELESCERELLEIQRHLYIEYQQKIKSKINHKEFIGTEEIANDFSNKIDELEKLANDMALCLKTRIAAWYVFSLYPGEQYLKQARKVSIQNSIDEYIKLTSKHDLLIKEIIAINSIFNFQSTLDERKKLLLEKSKHVTLNVIESNAKSSRDSIEYSSQQLFEDERPMRIYFQIENGVITEVRQGL